jgi:enoyl-CoA hydratase/carnithine racemase
MSEILSSLENRVLTLTFNRPEKMNALTRSMYSGLAYGLNEAAGDFESEQLYSLQQGITSLPVMTLTIS